MNGHYHSIKDKNGTEVTVIGNEDTIIEILTKILLLSPEIKDGVLNRLQQNETKTNVTTT